MEEMIIKNYNAQNSFFKKKDKEKLPIIINKKSNSSEKANIIKKKYVLKENESTKNNLVININNNINNNYRIIMNNKKPTEKIFNFNNIKILPKETLNGAKFKIMIPNKKKNSEISIISCFNKNESETDNKEFENEINFTLSEDSIKDKTIKKNQPINKDIFKGKEFYDFCLEFNKKLNL